MQFSRAYNERADSRDCLVIENELAPVKLSVSFRKGLLFLCSSNGMCRVNEKTAGLRNGAQHCAIYYFQSHSSLVSPFDDDDDGNDGSHKLTGIFLSSKLDDEKEEEEEKFKWPVPDRVIRN